MKHHIIRLHDMHSRGLLLQMSHVA